MKKPTIYDIRRGYEALAKSEGKQACFFSRGTLKFFHETMKNMKVKWEIKEMRVVAVKTIYHWHYFQAVSDGPYPYYRHLGTTLPSMFR